MIEMNGAESGATVADSNLPSRFVIEDDRETDLKPGDEVLILVKRSEERRHEDYGLAVRLTGKAEPEEDEIIVEYREKVFVAQKIPEFI